jgi:hypothetical protein
MNGAPFDRRFFDEVREARNYGIEPGPGLCGQGLRRVAVLREGLTGPGLLAGWGQIVPAGVVPHENLDF